MTCRVHGASIAGVLTLICVGTATGVSSADALRVRAQTLESGSAHRAPSVLFPPTAKGTSRWVSRPGQTDNPLRAAAPTPFIFAGDDFVLPAPLQALPSRSIFASATAAPLKGNGSQDDVPPPAAQAPAAQTATDGAHAPVTSSAQLDSPPRARPSHTNPLAPLTATASQGAWYSGPQGAATGLSSAIATLHDRASRLSPLGLERILDSQTFTTVAPIAVTRAQDNQVADLTVTAQRPPVAQGLKLVGVHPGATLYMQAQADAQPTATPTLAQTSYVSPATPVPGAGNWTVATMPGCNPRNFYVTGYPPTGHLTKTGIVPHWGIVAVDPDVIPLHSTVYIQGLGIFTAEDTGGAIIGPRVDVFVDTDAEAYALTGYRYVSFMPPSGVCPKQPPGG